MIEAMGLKIIASRSSWISLRPSKFHENLPSDSEVISGGQTDSFFGMIEVTFNAITTIQNFIQIHQSAQKVTLLRSLNVRHFEMAEATGLHSMESRPSSMSSSSYKMSSKSTNRFKGCTTLGI
jgi:hypothetical protein